MLGYLLIFAAIVAAFVGGLVCGTQWERDKWRYGRKK